MVEAGLIVICSFISPHRAEREMIRNLVSRDEFVEVFVDTPIDECVRRDPKGLCANPKLGKIPNFTGIGAPYQAPQSPEVWLKTVGREPAAMTEQIVGMLRQRRIIDP